MVRNEALATSLFLTSAHDGWRNLPKEGRDISFLHIIIYNIIIRVNNYLHIIIDCMTKCSNLYSIAVKNQNRPSMHIRKDNMYIIVWFIYNKNIRITCFIYLHIGYKDVYYVIHCGHHIAGQKGVGVWDVMRRMVRIIHDFSLQPKVSSVRTASVAAPEETSEFENTLA